MSFTTAGLNPKQAALVNAISRQIDRSPHYRDLLREASRDVGVSQAEALTVLDSVIADTDARS